MTRNSRMELQEKLETLVKHVYFQPPENVKMKYPCIVYERDGMNMKLADDEKYLPTIRYQVTYITTNPDTNDFILRLLESFKYIQYNRHFVSENLHHEIFTIYY